MLAIENGSVPLNRLWFAVKKFNAEKPWKMFGTDTDA